MKLGIDGVKIAIAIDYSKDGQLNGPTNGALSILAVYCCSQYVLAINRINLSDSHTCTDASTDTSLSREVMNAAVK